MTAALLGAALLAALATPHTAVPEARATTAGVSLSAWPSHVVLEAGDTRVVHLRAAGRRPLRVVARVAGYALDLRGRPRIARGVDAASWAAVRPRRITVGRAGASFLVSARRRPGLRPGDHSALVILTTASPAANGVLLRIRIGLVVSLRVPGALVHRLVLRAVQVRRTGRRRLLEVALANLGNVVEPIDAGRLRLTLLRRGRVVARLGPEPRTLLSGATGFVDLHYSGPVRGRVAARIELRQAGRPPRARSYWLRL